MSALLPALLLLLFAGWCGSLAGGPLAAGALTGQAALLATAVWAARSWPDPLRLGSAGRLLPAAFWVAMAASAWASPVPRAGRVAVLLAPAFLLLPAAVERAWEGEARRRRGLRAVSLAVAGLAGWALVDQAMRGAPRAAMPLGHHTLLAACLVAVLPLALLPLREAGPWRWVAAGAGGVGLAALVSTRSLAGAAGVVASAATLAALAPVGRRTRVRLAAALGALAVVVALAALPRLAAVAGATDLSARARAVYLAAGARGVAASPWLGWGPGSVPWTAARFLRPEPGVNPPSEPVGDLHSLPMQLAYELGLTGLLFAVALAWLFFRRRVAERAALADPWLAAAALSALAGSAVAALGVAAWTVTALPVAVALAAGAALAAGGGHRPPGAPWPAWLYAATALAALLPLAAAQRHYERAIEAGAPEASAELAEAIRLDPAFPLYRARAAWLGVTGDPAAAAEAQAAAREADGVAALWLVAGIAGQGSGQPWAAEALDRACALDPLAPSAPFLRLRAAPEAAAAPARGARALLAEPRLAAAELWWGRQALLASVLERVRRWPGVDAGWKLALIEAARARPEHPSGARSELTLDMDLDPSLSLSLYTFHRQPWPVEIPITRLDALLASRLAQPPAAKLSSTSPNAFSVCP